MAVRPVKDVSQGKARQKDVGIKKNPERGRILAERATSHSGPSLGGGGMKRGHSKGDPPRSWKKQAKKGVQRSKTVKRLKGSWSRYGFMTNWGR